MANRLAAETSPYLLQHKDNPVEWFPWGEEAFAEARRLDKPVLLSVGYSACHWCHVMEHESFEDHEIAAQMNRDFVSIKVDREERPDIDAIYMQAVQALTGRGGWPMTVFLTPEGLPFYGGTYYPPQDRGGMPGFPRVLAAVADAYRNKRPDLESHGQQLLQHLSSTADVAPGDTLLTEELLRDAFRAVSRSFDSETGGFGRAPKFPQSMTMDFLLRYHLRSGDPEALAMVEASLQHMARGGIYDQVGGGFHRYSTDAVWLVPHFEKMLYDNALLARLYLDAWKVTGNRLYQRIARQTLDYVLTEMTDPEGGFYSTQDADSEGEEGKFFLWTPLQLEEVLGNDAALVGRYYGVTPQGNFEDSNILHVPLEAERFLEALSEDERVRMKRAEPLLSQDTVGLSGNGGLADSQAFESLLDSARARLYAARGRRVHPARDEKVLTAWNGLMLRAFAEAALAFDAGVYREAAVRNADFLLRAMRPEARLLRSWKRVERSAEGGVAKLKAYLEDFALLIDGLIATYSASFEPRFLAAAVELADEMIDLFWDDAVQGFYDTGRDHETLITRPRDFFDNATPAGNSVALDVLLRLALLLDRPDYERRAVAGLRAVAPYVERAATMFGHFLCALDFYLSRPQELAIVWPQDASQAGPLLDTIRRAYLPHLLLAGARADGARELTPLLRDRPAIGGGATAYLCERYVCQAPATRPEELGRQLGLAT
jgi:hypothetical protein